MGAEATDETCTWEGRWGRNRERVTHVWSPNRCLSTWMHYDIGHAGNGHLENSKMFSKVPVMCTFTWVSVLLCFSNQRVNRALFNKNLILSIKPSQPFVFHANRLRWGGSYWGVSASWCLLFLLPMVLRIWTWCSLCVCKSGEPKEIKLANKH